MTRWDEEKVRQWVARTKLNHYQRIELPYGIILEGRDRSPTARVIFEPPPTGKRVLDIGCNYGYFCHEAARRGASSVTGIELDPERAAIARTISEIQGTNVSISQSRIEEAGFETPFDWILVLNVIHHVPDPLDFMRRVAALATERVIVEFPHPSAGSFPKEIGVSRLVTRFYDRLPFIGVRPGSHLGFRFTPKAFELTFIKHLRLFRSVRFAPSPAFPHRSIAFCER